MDDDHVVENVMAIYNNITHSVKDPKHMIKNVILKLTMGKAFFIGKKYDEKELKEVEKVKKEQPSLEKKLGKEKEAKEKPVKEPEKVEIKIKEGDNDG